VWRDLDFYDVSEASQTDSLSDECAAADAPDSSGASTSLSSLKGAEQQQPLSAELLRDASGGLVRVRCRHTCCPQDSQGGAGIDGQTAHYKARDSQGAGPDGRVYSMQVFELVEDRARLKLLKELHTLLRCRDKAIAELEDAFLLPPLPPPPQARTISTTDRGVGKGRRRRALLDFSHGPGAACAGACEHCSAP